MHVGNVIHQAGACDAPFLLDARSPARLSYRQFAEAVAAWQPALAGTDRVLLDIADPLAFAVAHLSVIAAGCDSIPIDPAAPVADIERTLRRTEPDLILSDRVERWPHRRVIDVTNPPQSSELPSQRPSRTGGVLMQTSGSTGEPKLIRLDERQLLTVAGEVAAHNRLSTDDRGYNPLPLFHINAQVVALLATLVAGSSLVLDTRFHRRGFWALIHAYEVTWINAVPAIWTILARDELPHQPAGLRFVRSASAPLPIAIRDEIQRGLGVPVVESYGMTEAASQITATDLDAPAPDGSAGRPISALLQVRNETGAIETAGRTVRLRSRLVESG
jgi:acyl-CoA synthetase (AMP-forming)/AMP-acid ligase II